MTLVIFFLFLTTLLIPASAAGDFRYSYINLDKMTIELVNNNMSIRVDYTLDNPIKLLIFLLGENDLKTKLIKVVNYEDVRFKAIELDYAELEVDNAVIDYGDGALWLPEHQFNATTPLLTVQTPQSILKIPNTNCIPNGVGYFRVTL
ncbi:MAG: hypothetical protein LUP99_04050 [Methanomicrobiales archaeon]|nr:hypothetical protein [Methanomicrobiales archaeon]